MTDADKPVSKISSQFVEYIRVKTRIVKLSCAILSTNDCKSKFKTPEVNLNDVHNAFRRLKQTTVLLNIKPQESFILVTAQFLLFTFQFTTTIS